MAMVDRVAGDVFHYPYLWLSDHERGVDNPKNRTTCLVLKTKDAAGITHLVILAIIESLAGLREKNIITEEEFSAKKAELLRRL